MLDLRNCDCLELMAEFPNKYFDLAIVDPPYGIGENGSLSKGRSRCAAAKDYKPFAGNDTASPNAEYFQELIRVSKNQIIWGANHFISKIALDSSCWIVWDKDNGECDFADCELAWSSFKTSVRRFKFRWAGMLQEDMKNKEFRIHPTQKPVALYSWLLQKYAKKGDKILDTHLGSGSIAIACEKLGFDLVGSELDAHYFEEMQKRISENLLQQRLF